MEQVNYRGVRKRSDTGVYYYEQRLGGVKLYSTKVGSAEVGALCYDIGQRYNELDKNDGKGRKRKTLNFEKYSQSLTLQRLPKDCDKERLTDIILKQALAAAKNLPPNYLNQDVGSRSPHRSSSHHTAHVKPLGSVEGKQDLPSESRHAEALEVLQKILDPIIGLRDSLTRKVNERKQLESLVAGVKNSGVIDSPDLGRDNFQAQLACVKKLFSADLSRRIEVVEQEYKSECRKLQEILQDHNSKSVHEVLVLDGETRGRQRVDESARLPRVIEVCSPDEHEAGSVSDGVSKCLSSASSPVDTEPCETDTTMLPVEMENSQHVAQYDESASDHNAKFIHEVLMRDEALTGRQRADVNGGLLVVLESCSPDEEKAGSISDGVSVSDVVLHDECAPDHISKSAFVALMADGDMPMCRQRADEMGRVEELESCSPDEPKAGSMSDDANKLSDSPACPPVDDYACLAKITSLPIVPDEMDFFSQTGPLVEDLFDCLDDHTRNSLSHAGLSWTDSFLNLDDEGDIPQPSWASSSPSISTGSWIPLWEHDTTPFIP